MIIMTHLRAIAFRVSATLNVTMFNTTQIFHDLQSA